MSLLRSQPLPCNRIQGLYWGHCCGNSGKWGDFWLSWFLKPNTTGTEKRMRTNSNVYFGSDIVQAFLYQMTAWHIHMTGHHVCSDTNSFQNKIGFTVTSVLEDESKFAVSVPLIIQNAGLDASWSIAFIVHKLNKEVQTNSHFKTHKQSVSLYEFVHKKTILNIKTKQLAKWQPVNHKANN